MLSVPCPDCGKILLVPEVYLDMSGKCRYCRGHVVLKKPFLVAAIDFETTGLQPAKSEILEVGAVIFDAITGHPLDRFCELARPSPAFARHPCESNRIPDEALKNCRPISQVLADFVEFISRAKLLIAHNAPFDAGFLLESCQRYNVTVPPGKIVDSLAWSYECNLDAPDHKLETLMAIRGANVDSLHRADSDSEGLRIVVNGLLNGVPNARKALEARAVSLHKMAKSVGKSFEILKRNPAWRNQPMSKRQRSNLIQLGAKLNQLDNLTKGEAADLNTQLRLNIQIAEQTKGNSTGCLTVVLTTLFGVSLLLTFF